VDVPEQPRPHVCDHALAREDRDLDPEEVHGRVEPHQEPEREDPADQRAAVVARHRVDRAREGPGRPDLHAREEDEHADRAVEEAPVRDDEPEQARHRLPVAALEVLGGRLDVLHGSIASISASSACARARRA